MKTILNMLCGAFLCALVGAALAVTGTPPIPSNGFGAVDGTWLNGLAGGQNELYQNGITAHAGGTQAACFGLQPGVQLYEVDTVATTADSVCLPFASAGADIQIRNAGANSMSIYGLATNNPLTAAADTINGTAGGTAYTVGANTNAACFVAKNGNWSCVKGS